MNQSKKHRAAAISAVVWMASSSAHAGPQFSLFGDGDHSVYESSGAQTTGALGLGGGLGVEIPLGSMTGIEVDGVYLSRKNAVDATYIQVPVLFRVWFGHVFTVAAGAYYDNGIGNVTVNGNGESFNAAGFTQNNFGVMGVVGFNIPVSSISLMIEGRYGLGIYNVSSFQGPTATFNDFEGLVGIRFGAF